MKAILPAIAAGFISTLIMTVTILPLSYIFDMSAFDFAGIVGRVFLEGPLAKYSPEWWFGLGEHLFNGAVLFPLIYLFAVEPRLPHTDQRWVRGLFWGMVLFLGWSLVILPLVGGGVLGINYANPVAVIFMTFNGHLIYGGLFGALLTLFHARDQSKVRETPTEFTSGVTTWTTAKSA